ncbi:MAG: CopG family transcriptional regulator [Candidatus Bathyarchaeia archaeon]
MGKVKTSIYADKELWEKYKSNLAKKGLEISQALEDLIKDELVEELLDEAVKDVCDIGYEVDFEPVKPNGGLVSILVRTMRDERTNSLS